jgi:uncharacterized caspase-like protein
VFARVLSLFFAVCLVGSAETRAVLVGISKYAKLPQDLWLQYADADAMAMEKLLGLPSGQAILLTNEKATTGAVREALRSLEKASPSDTVLLLIAGHGTVDSRGAYILTYDSDPENLAGTALPMAELQTLVQRDLAKTGRVVFLADVCRAATIGNMKTATVGNAVEQLGEDAGEMLGLMAARPAELSIESPEFGGGHGAFTWSVLEGLSGKADADGDGVVTAGELIDYVRGNVSTLTKGKQHPRDFGNMDNATKLASGKVVLP